MPRSVRSALLRFGFMLFLLPRIAGAEGDKPVTVAKIYEDKPFSYHKPEIGLEVREKFDFYDIDGISAADLRSQMRQKGTKWNDGKVYAALTTWDVRYRYDIGSEKGRYFISSVNTDVAIVYHFPRYLPGVPSSPLSSQWNDYMDHLRVHEYGHKDITVKIAGEINGTLASLGTFASRRTLDDEARRLVQAKLQRLKEAQVEYDADTHHGEKQGAILH